MIVIRLMLVAVLIAIVGLLLAWLFTRDAKYLTYIGRVISFALISGVLTALLYLIERVVLR